MLLPRRRAALSLIDDEPVFAIDSSIAQALVGEAFLRFVRASDRSDQAVATRSLIHAVRDGETLVIFPEGRLTVTGSLMKSMTARDDRRKIRRKVVPVRIEGLDALALLAAARARPAPPVPQGQVDLPGAGQAEGRRKFARQGAPRRRRARRFTTSCPT